ncbi:asparagine synthase (glutamine-hydrolyzing) [candidate division WOR-3 bacterium]|nr:asparagine synthase (glutamine-hydrolyzing) [candidate division WOR-3 bacterium]
MCGICGIISFVGNEIEPNKIKSMMKVLKHRGPDDEGIFIKGNIGLGHLRLSIIDLSSAGHQPMFDESGRYCIVYNGEVYNYLELKRELSSKYNFFTQTDTEVILYAYKEWGVRCLDHFNGMFSFAIYDILEHTLFLSRDRFGIKPLYYYFGEDSFVFASEIKSILQVVPEENIANDSVIYDYLVYNRTDHYIETFFKNIKRLDHGYYMLIKGNNVSFHQWYNLPERVNNPFNSLEDFRNIFIDSIRLRLRSDVPVGVCLSGGLDSSGITSILTSVIRKADLQTFSAVYRKGESGDESDYIDLYRDSVFKMHKTFPTTQTLYSDISNFVECHGEPVPTTGPYAHYKVMELAKGNVTVLLDGQGGDELLAGYHYFFGCYLRELLLHRRLLKFFIESFSYYQNQHSLFAFQSLLFYLLPNFLKSRAKLKGKNYLGIDFHNKVKKNTRLLETLLNPRSLQEALLNHFEYKLEHLLKWEDRNSMWFSLESRVPFLDYRLVERTLSLPSEKIITNGMTKVILRKAMVGILPEQIRLRQDKVGFLTPESEWLRAPVFRYFILELLHSDSFRKRPYFNYKTCIRLYNLHLQRKINISRDIWKWINLELWLNSISS